MDSAGIGMLLGRYKVIKMLGGQLELMNVNKQVEKVFEISGILKIIPLIKIMKKMLVRWRLKWLEFMIMK